MVGHLNSAINLSLDSLALLEFYHENNKNKFLYKFFQAYDKLLTKLVANIPFSLFIPFCNVTVQFLPLIYSPL